ncbi:hypothetical protein ACFSFZ_06500 [Mixta tenebrionis]|uniref:Uncharacterized protein n=1 Tax=Mixta tenebrionis TaxID=2562439 RepID=A0A506V8W9_9GAMM|nr:MULTISPECIES: hypothetical protein [Mixta]QHM74605.1 hypothetical protein C7M52_00541 [Mixta theicola]TPW42291.1 hypothetical protein FKM52_09655 [Mixta tenebrionis]
MRAAVSCFFIAVVGGVTGVGLATGLAFIAQAAAHFYFVREPAGLRPVSAVSGAGKIDFRFHNFQHDGIRSVVYALFRPATVSTLGHALRQM